MKQLAAILITLATVSTAFADPCGMVPPITTAGDVPITRIGLQKTYVFYKDGVETFVIRPGYAGNVDEFGMLIPFPKPPALRKVPDNIFSHIAAAADPPEVIVDLFPPPPAPAAAAFGGDPKSAPTDSPLAINAVRVLKKEAVGMYEVAVLAAGSSKALKSWMDDHGYRFPAGMDGVCDEYIEDRWCFVAVKTKVGDKERVSPRAGQRNVSSKLAAGAAFDGHVQAMGFRFRTEELVVPMRLSVFNEGDLRNVIYILSDGPKRIRRIPEEYVVRQVSGEQLLKNVTEPLPLRIIGGTAADIPDWRRTSLTKQRDPEPRNGSAKELFASDLLACKSESLSLSHEEDEKTLLSIGEALGLRGGEIDRLNNESLHQQRQKTTAEGLKSLAGMTFTIVDGDFPREVVSSKNLSFGEFTTPRSRNQPQQYNARLYGPERTARASSVRHEGALPKRAPKKSGGSSPGGVPPPFSGGIGSRLIPFFGLGLIGFALVLITRGALGSMKKRS